MYFFYMLLNLLFNLCVTWKYEGENPNYKLKPRSGSVFTNSETNQEDERLQVSESETLLPKKLKTVTAI